jgi:hypothetical protein
MQNPVHSNDEFDASKQCAESALATPSVARYQLRYSPMLQFTKCFWRFVDQTKYI